MKADFTQLWGTVTHVVLSTTVIQQHRSRIADSLNFDDYIHMGLYRNK